MFDKRPKRDNFVVFSSICFFGVFAFLIGEEREGGGGNGDFGRPKEWRRVRK